MFRRFAGLGLSESVPDHSSFWRFRNLPEEEQLYQPLLIEINQQLETKGYFIKQGEVSIIDASIIKAKQNRPNKGKDGNKTQDKEAAYNAKAESDGNRKTTYGFKTHNMKRSLAIHMVG
jgi:IS5 family transposase